MKIRILLYAGLREAVGSREIEMELPGPLTPLEIAERLAAQYPRLGPHLKTLAFAVDGEFVPARVVLTQARELALLPPVSGGEQST
ncbi:MAG: MoaD/ThiS family protein [candidate division KSB1 bacterium]|nr:MoaD/ThiS family protein [candidate division KSB1 bacterium]MDZ7272740.1 MoaD/ThiS family protein [candidate division KSB1 bacterium]MDZ7284235.1 MoaD/ThiS family protein [candidate division KSB1 bacterium]MDZ7297366.1 MoaD/ThiS family protein [candidate division KSB1 bacterium]MDZ7309060.1 MoaD/ThiS family protein [candidate division KSB1 bacterium]